MSKLFRKLSFWVNRCVSSFSWPKSMEKAFGQRKCAYNHDALERDFRQTVHLSCFMVPLKLGLPLFPWWLKYGMEVWTSELFPSKILLLYVHSKSPGRSPDCCKMMLRRWMGNSDMIYMRIQRDPVKFPDRRFSGSKRQHPSVQLGVALWDSLLQDAVGCTSTCRLRGIRQNVRSTGTYYLKPVIQLQTWVCSSGSCASFF